MDANAYADLHSSILTPLQQEVLDYTHTHHPKAHMISGHTQGMFLQMLSRMIRPQRILEIGTFTGFSALCLAEGLQKGGVLHTLELREEDAHTARKYFERSEHCSSIQLHVGDARKIIPTLAETWDLVFIDADKVSYIEYYEMVVPMVKTGGWIVADNVLFHGEVLQDDVKGKNAKAIAAFNQHVQADIRTQNVLLTVRDGLLLVEKR